MIRVAIRGPRVLPRFRKRQGTNRHADAAAVLPQLNLMEETVKTKTVAAFAAAIAMAGLYGFVSPAFAQTIIDEWANVPRPPAPELKSVQVDTKTTALLMLDFMNRNCGKRPSCLASIPAVKKLLEQARAKKMAVVYTLISKTTTADVISDVAPVAGEPWVLSGPDKFVRTDLEKILKDRGIKTVIAVGTSANGAVLYTASGAAFRGMNVIVPVDGMSSSTKYADLATAAVLTSAPTVSARVTLTRIDMITF